MTRHYSFHYDADALVECDATSLFRHLDDPVRLSAHMSRSSMQTGGMRMKIEVDDARGQALGSHIRLSGSLFGIEVFLDEAITVRTPPSRKQWETVGTPRLLIVGNYRMGFEIAPAARGSRLRVFIDYDLPEGAITRWLGRWLGGYYARWCTQQMLNDAVAHFASKSRPEGHAMTERSAA